MSRQKRKVAASDLSPAELRQAALRAHLKSLEIATESDYQEWCLRHGFSNKLWKCDRLRRREFEARLEERAEARLHLSIRVKKGKHLAVADVIAGKITTASTRHPRLAEMCRVFKKTAKDLSARNALGQLFLHLQGDDDFFDPKQIVDTPGGNVPGTYADALEAVAHQASSWQRPLAEWRPRHYNVRRRFASLLRHLFAQYDVPAFFDRVWFRSSSPAGLRLQRWYIHVAQGKNIRTADLPIAYTKRMAHHFLRAPADYSIEAALRYGQILGLGGDARLAEAIRPTKICAGFANDDFWITVLRFFIENPMLDTVHIGPIIDYLQDQRFEYKQAFAAPGVLERRPPDQPNLCMKGRTAESMLAQVTRWHRQLSHTVYSDQQWTASGLRGFDWIEGSEESRNQRRWTIRELLCSKALQDEGRAMRHCVASYAGSCLRRYTSIWSLELRTFAGCERVLTVEVQLGSKTICQARGKFNAKPSEKIRSVLQRWAEQAGLRLGTYV